MTTETETYPTEREYRDAMLRTDQRHIDGWRSISTSNISRTITWNNDIDPIPPRRQLTERQLLEELKPENVDIV